jgi:SGNH domain (fused to AT3 domains)
VNKEGEPFEWSRRCSEDFAALQAKTVREFDPDLVVWYSNRERLPVRDNDIIMTPGTPEHRARLDADLEAAYQRFAQTGADIVIVLPVPKAPPVIGMCAAAGPANDDCALDEQYYASFAELQEAFTELANRHRDRVRLVRIDDVLCPGERECPPLEQQGQAVRPDGIHFSDEGASWFVPILFERIGLAPLSAGSG